MNNDERLPVNFPSPQLEAISFQSQRANILTARPIREHDYTLLNEMLRQLSTATWYKRFLMPVPVISEELAQREAKRLALGANHLRTVLLATTCVQGREHVVAIAELVRESSVAAIAEMALLVVDSYQREGIGSALALQLVKLAIQYGVTTLRIVTLAHNEAVRRLVRNLQTPYTMEYSGGSLVIYAKLPMSA
ncbi:MAG: GNAT family N-acetyltransferase [Chloroflexales bacterium]|nr:GNAT family N-acetyltransferase [Chloroflexales bacterium]